MLLLFFSLVSEENLLLILKLILKMMAVNPHLMSSYSNGWGEDPEEDVITLIDFKVSHPTWKLSKERLS